LHQGAEYALALLIAEVAIHLGGAMEWVLVAVAAALALLAASTRGPLGALRTLSPRSHRLIDPALAVAIALSPLAVMHHLNVGGVLVAEAAAAALGYLALREAGGRSPAVGARAGGRHPEAMTPALRLPTVSMSSGWGGEDEAGEERGRGGALPPAGQPPAPAGKGRGGGGTDRAARSVGRAAAKAQEGALEHTDRLLTKGARRLGGMVGRRRKRRQG
jgi:hypothetical protein